ncbi:2-amino-4-hydroxy-6-hydroxymethyldihydropteridine diphosphokinase [Pseudidiomarina sediminum]|uniref:2-amino-4-hydroxy-6- hydroxymethyldihydropteridine diphosphokinase n=1 Tax=Pseudidiomarina sediminum TaxID=431675 RepID=UPI001C93D1E8|nr:2-amino-4-hydroxy-6-hydroxymethyldihydropteridine diphosphokinase [Pseudidiomarina sediminum]MBY6064841.1 2-amino-4-hydroxy-6-hydroxymethyldihydropteridine diphosphokinase [Pseudidiomarina sediminum]
MSTAVYIALGANLGEPVTTLTEALAHLRNDGVLHAVQCSSFYRSRPMGPQDQPDYVNAVLAATTTLAPLELLDYLQQVEQQFGRVRDRRWGARSLDLDLLLYGVQQIHHPRLTVPHVGLTERDFVLLPLLEIAPALALPDGRAIKGFVSNIANHDLIKIT